jgi:membrane protease YdiL (CAAX protease family)
MEQVTTHQEDQQDEGSQYTLLQIIGIWLAAGAPMWVLGWLVYPALSEGLDLASAGMLRIKLLTAGLIWQFVLSMIILYREEGNFHIETIRRRFWLNNPISPKTGEKDNRIWWLIIPLLALMAGLSIFVSPPIDDLWVKVFPFLEAPPGFTPDSLFDTPEAQAQWVGVWGLFVWFFVLSLFNTFLGEEFVFRGVLLPKMKGVFGKWDWMANAVIFTLYHLHQPWGLPGNLLGALVMAFTGRRFRSNWFPIILHSGQSVFFLFLILGLVLGLA